MRHLTRASRVPPRRAASAPALVGPVRRLAATIALVGIAAAGVVGLDGDVRAAGAHPFIRSAEAPAVQPRAVPPDASSGSDLDGPARAAAVQALLDRRSAAIRGRDRAGFLATVDPQSGDFVRRQAAVFDNMADVPFSEWRYQLQADEQLPVTDPAFARYDAPVWVPAVRLRYGLAGVDRQPTTQPEVFTFVRRDHGWVIGADDDLAAAGHRSWRGLWDFGPVVVTRGVSCLILAHPEQAGVLDEFAAAVDRAVPVVASVWGPDWADDVAVLVPQTQQEMSDVIGGDLDLAEIAAVATADRTDLASGVAQGQRVVVNPANLDRLGPVERQVVLQHEITHLAARASTAADAAVWLTEGFADYVGYLGSGLTVRSAAGALAADVARGDQPDRLPVDSDFDGDNPRLQQAYQQAWLACLMIDERVGRDGLVEFYRQAAAGGPAALDAAVINVLGTSYEQFVADWQDFLVAELG